MVSKHDRILGNLEKEILRRNTHIQEFGRNVEYGCKSKLIGEIDFYFYRNNNLYIFEVKSNMMKRCIDKAYNQLHRARTKFPQFLNRGTKNIYTYFVSSLRRDKSNTPKITYIK